MGLIKLGSLFHIWFWARSHTVTWPNRFCYCVLEVGFVEVGPGLLCLTSHTDVRPRAETGPVTSQSLRQELS